MDSLTQIVLGAAVGEATLGRKVGNKALLWGAIAGTIPDLDVISRFIVDDLTAAEWHRGFSHSILFCVIFAPIFGWLIPKLYKKKETDWKGWTKLMFWGFITHPFLDCHTTWGTQLFWPFKIKIAFNNIFVADPIYTVPFLICVTIVLFLKRTNPKRRWINNLGLIISSTYMVITIILKGVTFQVFEDNLETQSIKYHELRTNPTPLNSILWVAKARTDSAFLFGFYSLLDKNDSIDFFSIPNNYHLVKDIKHETDFKRLKRLSENYYTIDSTEEDTLIFNDLRFGLMGFDKEAPKVFSYKMFYKNDTFKVVRRRPDADSLSNVFGQLMERIKGQ